MTVPIKQEEAEMVIVALLGLSVTMTADYPTTHKYKVHADFGWRECRK